MIVDMTRNDLSRIATRGSVSVPSSCTVEKYPHMFQMTSEVVATSTASLVQILTALFPAASITGAPKPETMRIIAEEESSPRHIYTGTLGVITPHDRSWFNVAIRTALINHRENRTDYGIGSGIVWDSQIEREYEECIAKAAAVTRVAPAYDLFETILWEPQKGFFLLEEHLARIAEGANYLSRPFSPEDAQAILHAVARECSSHKQAQRVRLYLSPSGAMRSDTAPVTPLPTPYRLSLAQQPISSRDPSLYRKTTYREAYTTACARSPEAHDVILWNERGEITETRIANICLEIDGMLYTPPNSSGLLNGCYRSHLLKQGRIVERTISITDLGRASRIVLMNSLRRTWDGQLIDKASELSVTAAA